MDIVDIVHADRHAVLYTANGVLEALNAPFHPAMAVNVKSSRGRRAAEGAECAYLLQVDDQMIQYGKLAVAYYSDFLVGDWRNTVKTSDGVVDPLWWKQHLGWDTQLLQGIAWAMVLGDDQAAIDMAVYPDEHCPAPEGSQDMLGLMRALCHLVRSELEAAEAKASLMAKSSRRAMRLPAQGLLGIIHSDAKAASKATSDYNKMYRKARKFPDSHYQVSYWGTLIEQLARRAGVSLDIPEPEVFHNICLHGHRKPR